MDEEAGKHESCGTHGHSLPMTAEVLLPERETLVCRTMVMMMFITFCWRLKLEGETENMGVCTKERKGVAAEVLMATPCTESLGCEIGGHKQER